MPPRRSCGGSSRSRNCILPRRFGRRVPDRRRRWTREMLERTWGAGRWPAPHSSCRHSLTVGWKRHSADPAARDPPWNRLQCDSCHMTTERYINRRERYSRRSHVLTPQGCRFAKVTGASQGAAFPRRRGPRFESRRDAMGTGVGRGVVAATGGAWEAHAVRSGGSPERTARRVARAACSPTPAPATIGRRPRRQDGAPP